MDASFRALAVIVLYFITCGNPAARIANARTCPCRARARVYVRVYGAGERSAEQSPIVFLLSARAEANPRTG